MSGMCLAVSGKKASLFKPGKFDEARHIDLDGKLDARSCAESIRQGFGYSFRNKKLVVAANFERTSIRIAGFTKKGFLWRSLPKKDAWELIQAVFPFGAGINGDSHVFDVSMFGGKYFCCGLPAFLCEFLTALGTELTGSVHRLAGIETLEHLVYRHELEIKKSPRNKLIVFPQESGYRLLFARDGLPEEVFFVTNHHERRLDELKCVTDAIGTRGYELRILHFGCNLEWLLNTLEA